MVEPHLLLSSVGPMTGKSIFFFKSAREMWKDLEERCGSTSAAQLYSQEKELAHLEHKDENVAEFFTQIKVLWDELNNLSLLPICECTGCNCN